MGRYASKTKREEVRYVDINRWNRDRLLWTGNIINWCWYRNGEKVAGISVWVEKENSLRFQYKSRVNRGEWEDIDYIVLITRTRCNYGGSRPWFECPQCKRRVAKLYSGGHYFLCRHCHNITYKSRSQQKWDRIMDEQYRIRERLGDDNSLCDPLPNRPKGMHRRTYYKLLIRYDSMEQMKWLDVKARFDISV
jgi:hypothetical protein